ncbi:MAG: radical SAM protein [Methanobrevibacter sp.]|jgi:MoaA/NifB/PqqE/SkfB family radical SAM enzyme|nr:radical SAM protein [Methanobrevibacter sp.]
MLKKYPIIKKNYHLQIEKHFKDKMILKKKHDSICIIESDLFEVLKLCNGLRSLNEIIKVLSEKFNEPIDDIQKQLIDLFEIFEYIELLDNPSEKQPLITYSKSGIYPTHLDVEVTNHCNHNCIHCFNDSSPHKKNFIDVDKYINLLSNLKERGLKYILLTGGEPLTHPDINKLVEFSCTNFAKVNLNTNGFLLNRHIEFFKKFSNLEVQVTLNSSEPDIHEKFCGVNIPGLHSTVVENIKLAIDNDIEINLAMNIIPENVDDILNTAYLSKELGCNTFRLSEIEVSGRATSDLFVDMSSKKIEKIYNKLSEELGIEYVLNLSERRAFECLDRANCGIMSSFVAISAEGNIRFCSFAQDYLNFNNIFNIDIDEYFKTIDTLQSHTIQEPVEELCTDCKFYDHCSHCIYKALKKYDEIGSECKWGESMIVNHFIEEIKNLQGGKVYEA